MNKCSCGFRIGHPEFSKCICNITKPLSDDEITYQFQHKCPRFSRLDIFKYAVKWAEERHGIK